MSDVNGISMANRAIAAFKSTQALSRGGEQAQRRAVAVQPTEVRGASPDRTLKPVRTTVVAPDDGRQIKTVQVGDRRLAVRGSIIDILV